MVSSHKAPQPCLVTLPCKASAFWFDWQATQLDCRCHSEVPRWVAITTAEMQAMVETYFGLHHVATTAALCRQITDSFRKSYALLWQSLIFADAEGIKKHSQAMNAGDMYPLFAGMLTNRPWDEVSPTSSSGVYWRLHTSKQLAHDHRCV